MRKLLAVATCLVLCACTDLVGPREPEEKDNTSSMVQDSTGSITITIICPDCDSTATKGQ